MTREELQDPQRGLEDYFIESLAEHPTNPKILIRWLQERRYKSMRTAV